MQPKYLKEVIDSTPATTSAQVAEDFKSKLNDGTFGEAAENLERVAGGSQKQTKQGGASSSSERVLDTMSAEEQQALLAKVANLSPTPRFKTVEARDAAQAKFRAREAKSKPIFAAFKKQYLQATNAARADDRDSLRATVSAIASWYKMSPMVQMRLSQSVVKPRRRLGTDPGKARVAAGPSGSSGTPLLSGGKVGYPLKTDNVLPKVEKQKQVAASIRPLQLGASNSAPRLPPTDLRTRMIEQARRMAGTSPDLGSKSGETASNLNDLAQSPFQKIQDAPVRGERKRAPLDGSSASNQAGVSKRVRFDDGASVGSKYRGADTAGKNRIDSSPGSSSSRPFPLVNNAKATNPPNTRNFLPQAPRKMQWTRPSAASTPGAAGGDTNQAFLQPSRSSPVPNLGNRQWKYSKYIDGTDSKGRSAARARRPPHQSAEERVRERQAAAKRERLRNSQPISSPEVGNSTPQRLRNFEAISSPKVGDPVPQDQHQTLLLSQSSLSAQPNPSKPPVRSYLEELDKMGGTNLERIIRARCQWNIEQRKAAQALSAEGVIALKELKQQSTARVEQARSALSPRGPTSASVRPPASTSSSTYGKRKPAAFDNSTASKEEHNANKRVRFDAAIGSTIDGKQGSRRGP